MKYLRTLAIALALSLMGCATHIETLSPPSQPPVETMVKCQPLKELPFDNMGDAVSAVIEYISEYDKCAKRHNALVDFDLKRK